jgi:septum site-determining protein MinC
LTVGTELDTSAGVENRPALLLQERAFRALTVVPLTPVFEWLARLDAEIERSPSLLQGRPVVVDLGTARLHGPGARALLQELQLRGARVIGILGLDEASLGPEAGALPPVLNDAGPPDVPATPVSVSAESPPPVAPPEASGLVLEENIRSGQSVRCPVGDVTVVGSVASGAEIVAGGSIHVYGTLRGRALAGLNDPGARIFCNRLDAELLSINGVFLPADDMEPGLRGRAVRAWCDGTVIRLSAQD